MPKSTRRTAALAAVLTVALACAAIVYARTETLPPQPPVVTQVQEQMKRELRRGWLRVVLVDRVLEVRVNGEALLGYTGKTPRLEDVDTNIVRGMARHALELYAPVRYGPPTGVDSVRVRLRHSYMIGPIPYRSGGRNYDFATSQLGR